MKPFSRREFLKAAVASAAAAQRPTLCAAAGLAKAKVVVGAHAWVYAADLPNFDFTPRLPQVFADMRYAGVEGIELMQVVLRHDDAVRRIGALSREHHLPVIGSSFEAMMWNRASHPFILADAQKIVPRLAELGGRALGTSVGPIIWGQKIRKTPQQLDAQADLLRQLIALCERYGVVLNLHNHTYEVENGLYDLKGTLARIPEVKLGPDLGWMVKAGVDPVWFIRQYGRQLVWLHLRDVTKDGRWSEALGEGDTDFVAIGKALHEVGFHGDAVIELAFEKDFVPTRPVRESLAMSRRFVRRTLGY